MASISGFSMKFPSTSDASAPGRSVSSTSSEPCSSTSAEDRLDRILNGGTFSEVLQELTELKQMFPSVAERKAVFEEVLNEIRDQRFEGRFAVKDTFFTMTGESKCEFIYSNSWCQQNLYEYLCHCAVNEAISKWKDPETSWETIRLFIADARHQMALFLEGKLPEEFGKLILPGDKIYAGRMSCEQWHPYRKYASFLMSDIPPIAHDQYYPSVRSFEPITEEESRRIGCIKTSIDSIRNTFNITIYSKSDQERGLETLPMVCFIYDYDEIFTQGPFEFAHPDYETVVKIKRYQNTLAEEIRAFPSSGDKGLQLRLIAKYYYYGAQNMIMHRGGAACNEMEFHVHCRSKLGFPPELIPGTLMDFDALIRTEDEFVEFFVKSIKKRGGLIEL